MRGALRVFACIALLVSTAATQQSAAEDPRALLQRLNALRVNGEEVYRVREISLRRDAVRIALDEGKLAFLASLDGHITGAVFAGQGRVIVVPRDPVEKRSLARFLDAPLLDESFSRAYFRFTDNTAEELRASFDREGTQPFAELTFAEDWNPVVSNLNSAHSLRILADFLATEPQTYFYAGIAGDTSGSFDVLVDNRREEQILIGQTLFSEGVRFYDTWASFSRVTGPGPAPPFLPLGYAVETTIDAARTLEGAATVQLKSARGGERIVPLEMSRRLVVSEVSDEAGVPLPFFQNEEVSPEEVLLRGNDAVFVVLPRAATPGATLRLRITYRGSVISDAGNGVLFVGERGSWYPHTSGAASFVPFELTFRWPGRLTLVATGKKLEEREQGEWRVGRWKSEKPIPVAGFNLGEYVSGRVETDTWKIDLFANRQLEQAVLDRFNRAVAEGPVRKRSGVPLPQRIIWPDPPPSPAALMSEVGERLADAIRFYEKRLGPFPFERLAVAQIPGSFGQGWPGLLYLSTLSFLTPTDQSRVGIGKRTQEQFTELVPIHELAHQWWGNVVGWESYRDQWIQEGLANYLALLFADNQKPGELTAWLETYRNELTVTRNSGGESQNELGPLALGYRLRSSKSPRAYAQVIYPKASWAFHMLRMLLRQAGAPPVAKKAGATKSPDSSRDPDERFEKLLQALLVNYRHRALTTEALQREVEKVMTPEMDLEGSKKTPGRPGAMDWFFDQWVRDTGIPKYAIVFDVKPAGERFIVRGKLKQTGVPASFIAPVPIYEPRALGGKPVLLGVVVTNGEETPFQFTVRSAPKKLLIDPNLTLLCLVE
ncbi:MAG: hypothetical protein M1453_00775 [Acidobacteria bacterium]|nr:hypothetical protein [Acidobacteriota bacterium]MCL5286517.1 hypothetical protein [Acidobacteriota bacterium]